MHHRTSRRTLLTATAATAVAAVTGAVLAPGALAAQRSASSGQHHSAATTKRLKRIISGMSLEEKVGQLFVMRVYGHSATDPDQADIDANMAEIGVRTAAEMIDRYHVGGIIYFTWAHNTRDPHQIAELSNGIQRAGLAGPTPLPLLVSTDQEHGIVCRVGEPATLMPGAMALGAGGSRSDARRAGQIAGAELAAIGINQNYAPDADVNVNPANPVIGVRSFGSDPQSVAAMVAAQVKGYQSSGIASTAKHFPGHGDTSTDSHTGLPVITHTREQWAELDEPPFRAAIAAGIDSIMTAHIVVPALDPAEDPATLSRPILTGILREELGYDGVVVTDSLGMEGVRTKYGDERVPVLALRAGVDQLLNPPDLSVSWNAVLEAVKSGEISEARIDESILRILRLKTKLGLFDDPFVSRAGWTAPWAPGPTSPPPTGSPSAPPRCSPTKARCCRSPGAPTATCSWSAPIPPPRPAPPDRRPPPWPPPSANWGTRRPRCPPAPHPPRRRPPRRWPPRRARTRWSWRRTTSRRPARSAPW